jgi:hypothetical protein
MKSIKRGLMIVGASTLLFSACGRGEPIRDKEICHEEGVTECDENDVAHTCEDGKWAKPQPMDERGCECLLDPGGNGCPVPGYVGIAEVRPEAKAVSLRSLLALGLTDERRTA